MKHWLSVLTITFFLVVGSEFLLSGERPASSHFFGFFAVFGLIGCVGIVAVAKFVGHAWLQRDEGYYDHERSQ